MENSDAEKKRKREDISSVSSVSETDSSMLSQKIAEEEDIKTKYGAKDKKKDRKKKKTNDNENGKESEDILVQQGVTIGKRVSATENMLKSIHIELKKINSQMESMTTKSEIEHLFKTMFEEKIADIQSKIREDVYNSVTHRIDKVEGEMHTLSIEFDKVRKENLEIKQQVEDKNNEIQTLHHKHEKARTHYIRKTNELEQYTRKNSIRLTGPGLPIEENRETAQETTTAAVKLCNEKLGMDITGSDIDIAHRMGLIRRGSPRNMIVKFTSRLSKIAALKDKRNKLKGTGIFIQEDLTQLNAKVLKQVRVSPETETAWTFEGQIYAKYKANGNVEKVQFEDFENWLT